MAKPLVSWLPDPENREYWKDLKALLAPAAIRGGCEIFADGDLVWIAIADDQIVGAATTRLLKGGEAELKLVAGARFREWAADLDAMIAQWAKGCGARRMISHGRKGWAKLNGEWGWRVTGEDEDGLTTYEKVLTDG